jgi:DNA-binding response OmpR family regulator
MNSSAPQCLLIVEDDPDLVDVLSLLMEQEGIEVLTAQSAQRAIQILQARDPSLVILDLTLAGDEGFEVVDWLQATRPADQIPIVVVYTAQDVTDLQRQRLHLDRLVIITKSRITPAHFQQKIYDLLTQSS